MRDENFIITTFFRKIIEWLLGAIFFVLCHVNRILLKLIFLLKPYSTYLLKQYLLFDHDTRQQVIAKASQEAFDGLHPKNVFNFRSEFFIKNVGPHDVIIDLGCGTGLVLNKISKKIKRGIGIDYSYKSIDLCNKMHSSDNLKFLKGDILSLDYAKLKEEEDYTVAIFSHILEHIKDVSLFLKKVDAKRIIICVPSQENWLSQLKIHLKLPYLSDPSHFREYTRGQLADEVRKAGYEVRTIGFNSEGEIVCLAEKECI